MLFAFLLRRCFTELNSEVNGTVRDWILTTNGALATHKKTIGGEKKKKVLDERVRRTKIQIVLWFVFRSRTRKPNVTHQEQNSVSMYAFDFALASIFVFRLWFIFGYSSFVSSRRIQNMLQNEKTQGENEWLMEWPFESVYVHIVVGYKSKDGLSQSIRSSKAFLPLITRMYFDNFCISTLTLSFQSCFTQASTLSLS